MEINDRMASREKYKNFDKIYGEMVSSQLSELPDQIKHRVKHQIYNSLYKQNQKSYEYYPHQQRSSSTNTTRNTIAHNTQHLQIPIYSIFMYTDILNTRIIWCCDEVNQATILVCRLR